MMRLLAAMIFTGVLALTAPARAIVFYDESERGLVLNGTARTLPVYLRRSYLLDPTQSPGDAQTTQGLRAELVAWRDEARIELAYGVSFLIGASDQPQDMTSSAASLLRLVDFRDALDEGPHYRIVHNLDRLNASFEAGDWDVVVGRQAILHGSGRVIPASDIFAPFSPTSVGSSARSGIDAFRAMHSVTKRLALEGILAGKFYDPSQALYLVRLTGLWDVIGISTFAGMTYGTPTLAVDTTQRLGHASWYAEALGRIVRQDARVRATVGMEYEFPFQLRAALEGHFNSAGHTSPLRYIEAVDSPTYRLGETFLLARYYVALQLAYEATFRLHGRLSVIQNFADGSAMLLPSVSYDFAPNTRVALGATLGLGKGPLPDGRPTTEFGLIPDVYYGEVTLSF